MDLSGNNNILAYYFLSLLIDFLETGLLEWFVFKCPSEVSSSANGILKLIMNSSRGKSLAALIYEPWGMSSRLNSLTMLLLLVSTNHQQYEIAMTLNIDLCFAARIIFFSSSNLTCFNWWPSNDLPVARLSTNKSRMNAQSQLMRTFQQNKSAHNNCGLAINLRCMKL